MRNIAVPLAVQTKHATRTEATVLATVVINGRLITPVCFLAQP